MMDLSELTHDTWAIPQHLANATLLAALEQAFTLELLPAYAATVTYVDSFDWRLYRAQTLLHVHGRNWTLYTNENGELTLLQGGPGCKKKCCAQNFPASELRSRLEALLGRRCLLPLAKVGLRGQQIHLLNIDKKIVARMVIEEQQLSSKAPSTRALRLFPVRGYDEEFAQIMKILTELGIQEPSSPLASFEASCRAAGRQPLDYSAKFAPALDPSQDARAAMEHIYVQLLQTLQRNLPGLIDDLDSEFLHDARVALRRTRSALNLSKGVLDTGESSEFRKALAQLARQTGPTRDLDVYLLTRDRCLERSHPSLRHQLALFFDHLGRERRQEQKKMAQALGSEQTKKLLARWRNFLTSAAASTAPLASEPITRVAANIIHRRWKRVRRKGKELHAASSDEAVHQLRIECKQLRYSLEMFQSLYPPEQLRFLVKQLKKLQDILGLFNDISVQQSLLLQHLTRPGPRQAKNPERAAALGALMQSLYEEQQPLRSHFTEAFAAFNGPETSAVFEQLFRLDQPISGKGP